jgi:SAM-dependent methyltransferase
MDGGGPTCTSAACRAAYPVIGGVPVLIDESKSVFRVSDLTASWEAPPRFRGSLLFRIGRKLVPGISHNLEAAKNYSELSYLLRRAGGQARILIIGGGVAGQGIGKLLAEPTFDLVETDVYLGPRTNFVCDAHDLPFRSSCFDAVIAQAVLEHVVDPGRVVAEIHRVLKAEGLVYAETPFMQQVHMGRHDFTRYTFLGHRRLFRAFTEIRTGLVSGPGETLAWAIKYFFLSFVSARALRIGVAALSHCLFFWLKYFDHWLRNNDASFDSASAFYFLGRKSRAPLDDRELLRLYRGGGVF